MTSVTSRGSPGFPGRSVENTKNRLCEAMGKPKRIDLWTNYNRIFQPRIFSNFVFNYCFNGSKINTIYIKASRINPYINSWTSRPDQEKLKYVNIFVGK